MTEFEALYSTCFADVYSYLLRLCRDEALAEELTSETFFRAMEAYPRFRGDCETRVWLCQIAKNLYFKRQGSIKREQSLDDTLEQPSPGNGPEESLIGKDSAERARRYLHELGEPGREVFMWRVYGELSFKQIGSLFGRSENWACVTYHRARAAFRRRLEESENDT